MAYYIKLDKPYIANAENEQEAKVKAKKYFEEELEDIDYDDLIVVSET